VIDLSIVIPTYNEQQNIRILLDQWKMVCDLRSEEIEIIVVDDDSPDGTAEVVKGFSSIIDHLVLVDNMDRKGIASAWIDGCALAKGTYVGIMDGDLCHDPNDAMRLFDRCRLGDVDIVIGSRYLKLASGMQHKSIAAILASRVAQVIIRVLFNVTLTDATHSFRVFHKKLIAEVIPFINSKGNSWLMEFSLQAHQQHFRFGELPITYGRRVSGETKLNLVHEGLRLVFRMAKFRFKK